MSIHSDKLSGRVAGDSYSARQTAHSICRTLVEAHCTLADARAICEMVLEMLERNAVLSYPLSDLGLMDEVKREAYFEGLVFESK